MTESRPSKRGLIDFIAQRLTAVIIGIYVVHIAVIFALNGDMDYVAWRSYFTSGYALLLSSLTVLAIAIHAWVGMWTVGTDYIRGSAVSNGIRLAYQVLLAVALLAFLVWSLGLIWGLL
ncbi:MAG: succinate dehydrogenase, hydrophobic membrane anchor protein [Gammaproteobacteria bacterium]|nr:succinate dehydrogenase, hydrophobic membrane anchor protein [Gammaproteobacteria bacterium]